MGARRPWSHRGGRTPLPTSNATPNLTGLSVLCKINNIFWGFLEGGKHVWVCFYPDIWAFVEPKARPWQSLVFCWIYWCMEMYWLMDSAFVLISVFPPPQWIWFVFCTLKMYGKTPRYKFPIKTPHPPPPNCCVITIHNHPPLFFHNTDSEWTTICYTNVNGPLDISVVFWLPLRSIVWTPKNRAGPNCSRVPNSKLQRYRFSKTMPSKHQPKKTAKL